MNLRLTCIFFVAKVATVSSLLAVELNQQERVFFEKKIRPILVDHCYRCHSENAKEVEGGLLLDTREGIRKGGDTGRAVVPNRISESLLMNAIQHGDFEMPPDKKRLPDEVIANFSKWIKMGAPDPREGSGKQSRLAADKEAAGKHWAYQPLLKGKIPVVKKKGWPRGDIDHFVLAKLDMEGLAPVDDADRYTLLRRATYDLTGLPPTVQEIEDFVNDKDADAFEKVVDRLLKSQRFGERWGRHWLDVARYADSSGGGRDFTYTNAWRYRDYVIDSFNKDKAYNQFVREQVAGDLLPYVNDDERRDQLVATGFLVIGPKNLGERDKEVTRWNVIDEQIDTLGRAFLGLTLGCARCHKHKFDPVSLNDYYGLAGIFSSTRTLKKPKAKDSMSKWQPVPLPVGEKEAERLKAAFAKKKTAAYKHKKKALAYVDELEQQMKKLQSQVARDRKREAVLEKKLVKAKFDGDTASGESSVLGGYLTALPMALAVNDMGEVHDENIRIRGQTHTKGQKVARGFLSVLMKGDVADIPEGQSGRLQLAEWLIGSDSPASALSSRVMVNRVWNYLFGAGIVRTADNFGAQGESPSHPEMLDHLAQGFIDQGWSVKKLIREIMLSRVYQLAAEQKELAAKIDPDNRLLWRTNGRRMDVEAIRDSILTISGLIDHHQGGSTLTVVGSLGSSRRGYRTVDINPYNRRGVYLPIIRSGLSSSMDMYNVFDFPDSGLVTGRRNSTTVPTQALYLMNSSFMVKNARTTAKQLLGNNSIAGDERRIEWAFLMILGRKATEGEVKESLVYIAAFQNEMIGQGKVEAVAMEEAWTSFCQSLFACNEFLFLN